MGRERRGKWGGREEEEKKNPKSLILNDSCVRSIWTYLTAGETHTHTHEHTHRERERGTDRQTETDRETYRNRDRDHERVIMQSRKRPEHATRPTPPQPDKSVHALHAIATCLNQICYTIKLYLTEDP